ncbi:hypothetical protein EST38_g6074 [Candolleomyces aberdarensis]|uniref:F-box domain-containing protein n=1 Tax=Candolleomyces aberdarensis TaxID=2316362 RepID=A0A4Q2DKN7_9AGAR|nr:hypothetical protein EST38_g6074 [Candolleomyces aberdarensis]
MFMTNFPQELVDHVIDQLYDDAPSLKSCARVCRAWLPASRFHLFAKVSLKAASMHGPASFPSACCKRLLSAIEHTPEIASCIRELEVCEGSSFHFNNPTVPATTWATTDPCLLALFKRLKNLRRLDFSATSTLYWKTLPPAFQNAFCSLLAHSPSLTYLRLHSWCLPSFTSLALLLSHCKKLKGFSLSSTTVNDDDGIEEQQHGRLRCVIEEVEGSDQCSDSIVHSANVNLEVLTLDFVSFGYLGASGWLFNEPSESSCSNVMDVSRLRELRVAHFPDISIVERLLVSVGPALEHLHLKPGCWNVQPFNLSSTTGLRSLRLTLEEVDTAMDWVTTFISSIIQASSSASGVLERIGLEFYIDVRKLDGWKELDALLSQPELVALRHIDIGLFASPSNPDFVRVDKQFRVRERGVDVRLYQLGLRSQKSHRQLTPRISRYEG